MLPFQNCTLTSTVENDLVIVYGLNESTFQFKIKEIQWFMLGHGK